MQERRADAELTEDERRQRQIERNQPAIALLDSWLAEAEEPTREDIEQFCEFMRGIDSHRPHRPLFSEYIEQICGKTEK